MKSNEETLKKDESCNLSEIQRCIEKYNQGDDSARNSLLTFAYNRFCALARNQLQWNFPRLKTIHSSQSFLQEMVLKLLSAFDQTNFNTAEEFLGYSSKVLRSTFLDAARVVSQHPEIVGLELVEQAEHGQREGPYQVPPNTWEPEKLARWTEFHRQVDSLPEEERIVVDLYFYQELTQEQTADCLGIDVKTMRKRWRSATRKLGDYLP